MKNIFLNSILPLVLVSFAQVAKAETRVINASDIKVSLGAKRPSCDMVAFRWMNALSRLSESEGMNARQLAESGDLENLSISMGRLAQGSAEGSDELISEEITFKAKDISESNFGVDVIDTAAIKWANVTANITDRVSFNAENGKLTVIAKMTYGQYCFYPTASVIAGTINGHAVQFKWNTEEVNLDFYLQKLK